jgi:hypothetical protein
MRRVSKTTLARIREVSEFRKELLRRVGHCEVCGHDPKSRRPGAVRWVLHVHEIARGPCRQSALDKPYAVLVVCHWCHEYEVGDRGLWPDARQLAVLKRSRPADYDLALFNELIGRGPGRVTEEEVALHGGHRVRPSRRRS